MSNLIKEQKRPFFLKKHCKTYVGLALATVVFLLILYLGHEHHYKPPLKAPIPSPTALLREYSKRKINL